MEAKELRIGNWINVGYDKQFDLDDFQNYFGEWKAFSNDAIEPIPITPEILQKAGLKERYAKGEWSWFLGGKWRSYTEIVKKEDGYKFLPDYPNIKYLHQLQNLYFALTGEELEVVF